MKCRKYKDLISNRYDGKIEPEDERALQEHLDQCRDCRDYAEAFQSAMEGINSLEIPELSKEQQDKIWESLPTVNTGFFRNAYTRNLALTAAALLIFIFGYVSHAWIHDSVGMSEVSESIGIGNKVCAVMLDYDYEIDPYSIYQVGQGSVPSDSLVSELSFPVPSRLDTHGPYRLRPENIVSDGDIACLPFVSPYGQVVVLKMTKSAGNSPNRAYLLSEATDKVLYHRVTWIRGGWKYHMEGRVPADYILDLAMEMDRKVRTNT